MSIIDKFVDYSSVPCLTSPKNYLWWAGLGLISATVGRGFWTFLRGGDDEQDRLYPNLFIVLLGIPGTGKSVPIDEVKRFLISLDVEIQPDHFTVESAVNTKTDAIFRYLPRSFSSMLDEQSSQAIKTFLCDGYDCTAQYSRATKERGKVSLYKICQILITACTPSHLNSCFKRGDWQEGLPSRFIYVWGEKGEKREAGSRNKILEQEIIESLQTLKDIGDLGQPVSWSPKALGAKQNWEASESGIPTHINAEGYWSRRGITLAKIATCIALSNLRTIIEEEDWELAVERLTETEKSLTISLGSSATNPYYQATQWLLRWLEAQKKIMTEAEIRHQMSWNFHPRDVELVLEDLIKRGSLCIEPGNPMGPRKYSFHKKEKPAVSYLQTISSEKPTLAMSVQL